MRDHYVISLTNFFLFARSRVVINQIHLGLINPVVRQSELHVDLRRDFEEAERLKTDPQGHHFRESCTFISKRRNVSSGNRRSPAKQTVQRCYGNTYHLFLGEKKRSDDDSTPAFKPDAYLDLIEKKVEMMYDETSGAPEPVFQSTTQSFSDLKQCTMADLEKIIKTSPVKSCELDPIPTFLPWIPWSSVLLPFIHIMCNKSISTGTLPSSQKRAIVTPRLKKKGMDLGEPSSFRPISNLSLMSKIFEIEDRC